MPPFEASVRDAQNTATQLRLLQQIHDIQVRPGVNVVEITFQTVYATIPIVEVWRTVPVHPQAGTPIRVVFPVFAGARNAHSVRVDELQPNTQYNFRITAAGGPLKSVAKEVGGFFTATRQTVVGFERLDILQIADGDMRFSLALYDGNTDAMIGDPVFLSQDAEAGQRIRVPFSPITLEGAPSRLRVYLFAFDQDDDWEISLGLNLVGMRPPDTTPEGAGTQRTVADDWITADAMITRDLEEFPGTFVQPFALEVLPFKISFSLVGSILTTVTEHPRTRAVRLAREAARQKPRLGSLAVATDVGQAAGIGGKQDRAHVFTPGPDGRLYRRFASANGTRRDTWVPVGNGISPPVVVLAGDDDGRIDLFAAGETGGILHARLRETDDSSILPDWQRLGEDAVVQMTAARGRGGDPHLFVLDRDGTLRHMRVGNDGRQTRRWQEIGRGFGGALSVVGAGETGFHLFVSDVARGVFHRQLREDDARGDANDWTPLGDAGGPVVGTITDDGVAVVGFRDGTPAVYKTLGRAGEWQPRGDKWNRIEAAEDAAPEPSPRGRRKAAPRASPATRTRRR